MSDQLCSVASARDYAALRSGGKRGDDAVIFLPLRATAFRNARSLRTNMKSPILLAVTCLSSLWAAAACADPTPVTDCGQTVTIGVLTADLDCTGAPGFAVTIEDKGSLDLAGHTLVGTADYGQIPFPDLSGGVNCQGGCTISGGTIAAPASLPDGAWQSHGLYSDEFHGMGNVVVSDVELTGWTGTGIRGRRITISNSTFTANNIGVSGRRVEMDNCVFNGNWRGMQVMRKGSVSNTTVADSSEYGIFSSSRLDLVNSLISNSGEIGFEAGRLRAQGSTIENSCQSTLEPDCADIRAPRGRRPRLDGSSTCGTSLFFGGTGTWGVCAND